MDISLPSHLPLFLPSFLPLLLSFLSPPLLTLHTSGQLYCLQARPIVTLPPSCFFDLYVPGTVATLWDNSNIVESYAGVTSPLTFSFASHAYEQVWRPYIAIILEG